MNIRDFIDHTIHTALELRLDTNEIEFDLAVTCSIKISQEGKPLGEMVIIDMQPSQYSSRVKFKVRL